MLRIRTIKPEFFRHEGLFELEKETGLPIRVAFAGLFCACDKEGRFEWKPRQLKLDILPWDDCDFSRVLHALATRHYICKYASEGREYGAIPSWRRHQVLNNREKESILPNPDNCQKLTDACATRAPRDMVITQGKGKGKGKGREGEKEGEGNGKVPVADASQDSSVADAPTAPVWLAYSERYQDRYGVLPVRNAKVNGMLARFCARVPADEAPHIAAYYLGHNSAYYVQRGHPVDCLLADAEKIRTEWATNRTITVARSRQVDKTESIGQVWRDLIEKNDRENQTLEADGNG